MPLLSATLFLVIHHIVTRQKELVMGKVCTKYAIQSNGDCGIMC